MNYRYTIYAKRDYEVTVPLGEVTGHALALAVAHQYLLLTPAGLAMVRDTDTGQQANYRLNFQGELVKEG